MARYGFFARPVPWSDRRRPDRKVSSTGTYHPGTMKAGNLVLRAAAVFVRNSPPFRGLGRSYRALNSTMLRLGAEPLARAQMKDGSILRVDLRTHTEQGAYYTGHYDDDLIGAVKALLDVDACFLDVGGNIGFYTVAIGSHMRRRGGLGRVVAFEALADNCRRLRENIGENDLAAYCRAEDVALSDNAGLSEITLREDFTRGGGTGNAAIPTNEAFDRGFRRVPIRLDRLDAVWPRLNQQHQLRIDLIKLDIEGHEDLCLIGTRQDLKEDRHILLMEINKPYYEARKVRLDDTFLPLIPERYSIFRPVKGVWTRIESLEECGTLDNVFVVPQEKLPRAAYKVRFRESAARS